VLDGDDQAGDERHSDRQPQDEDDGDDAGDHQNVRGHGQPPSQRVGGRDGQTDDDEAGDAGEEEQDIGEHETLLLE
jgi:hypothetical protein